MAYDPYQSLFQYGLGGPTQAPAMGAMYGGPGGFGAGGPSPFQTMPFQPGGAASYQNMPFQPGGSASFAPMQAQGRMTPNYGGGASAAISDPRDAPSYQGPSSSAVPRPAGPSQAYGAPTAIQPGQGALAPGAAVGTGGTQAVDPYNPFKDMSRAVMEGIQRQGYDTTSSNPLIKQILSKATELMTGLMGRATQADPSGTFFADPASEKSAIDQLLQAALSGQAVFPGAGGGGALSAIESLGRAGGMQGSNPGAALINQLLGDPQSAANIATSLSTGGMDKSIGDIVARRIGTLPLAAAQASETGAWGGLNASDSWLSFLLRNQNTPGFSARMY